MYYLDTQTIENAYNSLTSLELGDQGANAMCIPPGECRASRTSGTRGNQGCIRAAS